MINNLKTHVGYIILILLAATFGWMVFHSWITEHDARLLAETKVADSEKRVATLEDEKKQRNDKTAQDIAALKAQLTKVRTPQDVVNATPNVVDMSRWPINVRTIPGNGVDVQVAAQPFYAALNECKQTSIALGACQANAATDAKILSEKQEQIDTLKHPKGFWKRLGGTMKTAGITAGVTLALRAILKGGL